MHDLCSRRLHSRRCCNEGQICVCFCVSMLDFLHLLGSEKAATSPVGSWKRLPVYIHLRSKKATSTTTMLQCLKLIPIIYHELRNFISCDEARAMNRKFQGSVSRNIPSGHDALLDTSRSPDSPVCLRTRRFGVEGRLPKFCQEHNPTTLLGWSDLRKFFGTCLGRIELIKVS